MANILEPMKNSKNLKNLLTNLLHRDNLAEALVYGMQIHFFKKYSIWHELYCKEYFFAIGNSGCNGWASELSNNRYLAPYKRIVVFP